MMIKILTFCCGVFLSLLLYLTIANYRKLSELDNYNITHKRGYFNPVIARIFENKLTESFTMSRDQIFYYLSTDHLFRFLENE